MTTSSMASLQGASSSLSSASTSSIHPWSYDVFLSFRGKDVRQKFISHLYNALDKRGISTYIDDELEREEEISQALFQAIERSMISIIVLSRNYAESKWCLNEILKILECVRTIKQIILPIFYDVDPSDVRHQKKKFGEAFAKLKGRSEGKVELVLKWEAALEELANMSGLELKNYRKESELIQEIIRWVDFRVVNHTPLSVAKYPIGLESRIQDIYQHLSIGKNDIVCMLGIFGTGGIGKTTISKDIYNRISSQFEGSCFLKNIRETSKRAGGVIQLQNTLLSTILGISFDVSDIDRGINVIRHRLCSKRVLLILDDVDELVQIEKLAGDRAWFGSGSRIIITTRDQQLLKISEVDSECKLKNLDDNEALRLFSLHAFKKDEPLDDYVELSKQVIKYAQGLPLALIVLGSDLKGQSIYQWKIAIDKYKSFPNRNIQKVLLVSYEGLDDTEREMFLDIAFFVKGEPFAGVIKIFDSCGFSPVHGIQRLIDKCLITIEDEYVLMHDLLQNMGREIVRLESPKEPSKRSRLWFHEDIREVLEESTGTNKIEGMIIDMPKGEDVIRLSPKAFVQMKGLRVFINRNASFSSGPNYLSNKLRVLDWFEYPLQSLPPNFLGNRLIILKMRGSFLKELGMGFKFKNVTTITFDECNFLTKISDLSSISNLKELNARRCTSLVEVHDSVGHLDNLSHLSFFDCSNLEIFPTSLKLRSLHYLDLRGCSSFRDFPKIECEMRYLHTLNLAGTVVEELPVSIGNLTRLDHLILSGCKNLMRLPINSILQLQHLSQLGIGGCTNLVKKMGDDRQSILATDSTRMEDEISSSHEEQVHELAPPMNSRNGSSALQVLNLQNCFQSKSSFFPISSFFTVFNSSATLKFLYLSKSEFVSLPTSIKGFVALNYLYMWDCKKLEEVLELPPNIRFVNVQGCKSLERFPEVSKILEFNGSHIRSLQEINICGCDKMHEKIWNYKVPNSLLWKGHYDATVFPENEIPGWFRYQKEFLKNKIVKRGDNDFQLGKNEEWVINIEGPHYLKDISGIVVYAVVFYKEANYMDTIEDVEITSNSSNHVCRINLSEGFLSQFTLNYQFSSKITSLNLKYSEAVISSADKSSEFTFNKFPESRIWSYGKSNIWWNNCFLLRSISKMEKN
ncbi:disease resistance protein RPV1-like [Juglans regia]|uniref:Disease resistance protein RPV1-like n=2 Tax=Juglans regia TaxID=51240 RepID=A0A6P9EGT4_JUGRE|nr:disease resistance protein RPV1-like [Juglans regia]